jgi:DNA-binding CsgD family transcriptional regulator/tetratricopeptide (TPR) repeat protein
MERALADARTACADRRWGDARRRFAELPVDDLDIDDLDAFATAAYLTGHDEDGFGLWVRAHQRCIDEGTLHRAAHFGMQLAGCLGFKGDLPRCRGWVDRTARLLEEANIDCVEQGYLEHALAMGALFEMGDIPGALEHFERALKLGARFATRELVTLARIGQGRMMIYLGDVADGMTLLDEAMTSIEAGELSTVATGNAYCTVIDACAELSDVKRCRSWTTSMLRWCDAQQELVLYRGHCFIHSAEVLGVLGRWVDALAAARHACDRLAGPVPAALGAATCLEADLLRLLGELDQAEAAYGRAHELGHDPQPGLSLLRLARGDIAGAAAMIRRVLAECEGPVLRSRRLAAAADIALAAGDLGAAREANDELRAIGLEFGSPMLKACASRGAGAVHLQDGDATAALIQLRAAFTAFSELDARDELARTRLLIAEACRALGDHGTADLEAAAARSALASFCGHGEGLAKGTFGAGLVGGLTQREVDVLLLLARGKSNRDIGRELFISEKTVASHVSHIFTKLGVTSRSAATAFAYDHRLV